MEMRFTFRTKSSFVDWVGQAKAETFSLVGMLSSSSLIAAQRPHLDRACNEDSVLFSRFVACAAGLERDTVEGASPFRAITGRGNWTSSTVWSLLKKLTRT